MITVHDLGHRAPAVVNHIGITVPDVRAAVEWYGEAFGFACIMGPRIMRPTAGATAEAAQILGPRLRLAYRAHLLSVAGAGLELFQFVEPAVEGASQELEYWRQGIWHLCLTERDVAGAAARILALGGDQVCPVADFVPGRPWQLVYLRDPWGTTIEVMSHSYAEVFSNWPHPGATATTEWLDGAEGRTDG